MTKENRGVILSLLIILLFTFFVPQAVAYIEDYSLREKTQIYEAERINLTPDESYLLKELEDISFIIEGQSRNYVDTGEKMTLDDIRKKQKELLLMLTGEKEINIIKNKISTFISPSVDFKILYVIWECSIWDDEGNNYYLLIDDNTGKMLSFMAPLLQIKNLQKTKKDDFWGDIINYYGLEEEIDIPISIEENMVCFNMYFTDTLSSVIDMKEK